MCGLSYDLASVREINFMHRVLFIASSCMVSATFGQRPLRASLRVTRTHTNWQYFGPSGQSPLRVVGFTHWS